MHGMVAPLRSLTTIGFLLVPATAVASSIAGPVAATVERVIDGDTVRVSARIWVGHTVSVSVRIAGVDAPEIFRPRCAAEKDRAREAKAFVETLLGDGDVTLHGVVNDKYGGRVVASIETAEGADVGDALLEEGLAVAEGEAERWCDHKRFQ
jgi:endonuclease YncB( thermonuclease family)